MARVLLVEDDPDIRDLVSLRLVGAGHRVLAEADADHALSAVSDRGAPELVVLDVGLPGMDGIELLARLREQSGLEELPAVFLSARVQEHDVARGRAMGATYLTKPFVASALLAAVATALTPTAGHVAGW